MAKKVKEPTSKEICQGIVLSPTFFEKKENRLFTLILKGIIVYLLSMGCVGFYLSAIDATYNVVLVNIVIFVMALFCAFLYYRLLTENVGYLIMFLLFGGLVYLLRTYLNSGLCAIVNMTTDKATQYLNINTQKYYVEQITNRYVTVTLIAIFIGIVFNILLNVYISRRMQYMTAMVIVMVFNLIPLYFILEPNVIYAFMILLGISLAYVIKSGRHYSPQVKVKRNDNIFVLRGRKKEIFYYYDIKALLQASIFVLIFVLIMVSTVCAFKPKSSFNTGYKENKYKELTVAAVATYLVEGWAGFFDQRSDAGGLDSGELGNVGSVHLDHETDLVVEFTPYVYDTVYLKSFVGVEYLPYDNVWLSNNNTVVLDEDGNPQEYDERSYAEAKAYKNVFDNNGKNSAKAIMKVRNIDGNESVYYPYYTYSAKEAETDFLEFTYYPDVVGNECTVSKNDYDGSAVYDIDLQVPDDMVPVIEKFLENYEVGKNKNEQINNLIDYYQENIPYTIKPGKTPRKEDFVKYFLLDNKKGYCAHYASAATLIFRYLGIPARYVEGYAINYNDLEDAELIEDAKYSDYYTGFSPLGETAFVKVNVTDASAHAWVEIYDEKKGWCPIEVTPYGEMEESEDFWTMFDEIMNDDSENTEEGGNNFAVSDKLIRSIIYTIFGIFVGVIFIIFMVKLIHHISFKVRFKKYNKNDQLIVLYSMFYKKKCRRYKELKHKLNYEEEIDFLYGIYQDEYNLKPSIRYEKLLGFDREKIVEILNRAGFSDKEISMEDYSYVCNFMNL